MRRKWIIALGVALAAGTGACAWVAYEPWHPVTTIQPSGKLILSGVTVVDVADGKLSPNMDVLTERGKIVSIAPAGGLPQAAGTQVVSAPGKFLVPGFNDFHAHPLGPFDVSGTMALMLANGITGFRQMSGSPRMLEERAQGRTPTGRYAPEALLMPGTILTPFNAGSPDEARREVDAQKKQGADFIKVGLAAPDIFLAAEDEARKVGLPFVGHLQPGVDAAEASRRGMRAIEHLGPGDTEMISCSTDEAALRQAVAKQPVMKAPPIKIPFMDKLAAGFIQKRIVNPSADADEAGAQRYDRILATFDESKCRTLAATFVKYDTWQIPTLIRLRTIELSGAPEYANDPNYRYMPPETVALWRETAAKFAKNHDAAKRAALAKVYGLQLRMTKIYDDAGVKMLAGSDVSGQWEVPGFSLHQEFDELAKAGLSPLKILQMTTIDGGAFMGRPMFGRITTGANADFVLLDANPLDSVQNLHRIAGVVRAGYYYSRSDLDGILRKVEAGKGYFH